MTKSICVIEACGQPVRCRQLCALHYDRARRGHLPMPPRTSNYGKSVELRFWEKVESAGDPLGCWLWVGARSDNGYGHIEDNGRWSAHRWVYEHMVAPIPDGLHIDHLCRVRNCVNPYHLEPVPQAVNTRRGAYAKPACKNGHIYAEVGVYVTPDGYRQCRECGRQASKRAYAKRRRAELFAKGLSECPRCDKDDCWCDRDGNGWRDLMDADRETVAAWESFDWDAVEKDVTR